MSALPTKRIAGFDSTAQGQILFSPNGDARGGDPATWLHMWSKVMFQVMIELKMWLLISLLKHTKEANNDRNHSVVDV